MENNSRDDQQTTDFYDKLWSDWMKALMSTERHNGYMQYIKQHCSKRDYILDCGCWYGRLTVSLSKEWYNIHWIDVFKDFIDEAIDIAKKEHTNCTFKVWSMLSLPYESDTFDVVICMWSVFNHLLQIDTQLQWLQEIWRVLKKWGKAIIDCPYYEVQEDGQLISWKIWWHDNIEYIHTKKSLTHLLEWLSHIHWKVKIEKIGEKQRLILHLTK